MPAGGFPAGYGPAGVSPLPPPVPPRDVSPPAALWFDGASQDFLLDPATGLYVPLHPTDQRVALALLVNLGSVASDVQLGAAFRLIRRVTLSTETEVTRAARDALGSLVSARQIRVVGVGVELYTFGGFACEVTYENLLTKRKPTFTAPTGTFTGTS